MLRAIILSLVLLISVGVMLPFVTEWSEASRPKAYKKRKKIKKYSKAWWRNYRAKQHRQRVLAARKRELAKYRTTAKNDKPKAAETVATITTPVLGSDAPKGWSGQVAAGSSDVQFRVADHNGQQIGSASLSVVGAAMPANDEGQSEKAKSKTLAGVPVSALRRTVIDKMIRENGWIVNDYQREVNGKRVFVVAAQTPGGSSVQSRMFYFTEVDGRIYSLATSAPNEQSERLAADSERILNSVQQRSNRPVQAAANLR